MVSSMGCVPVQYHCILSKQLVDFDAERFECLLRSRAAAQLHDSQLSDG